MSEAQDLPVELSVVIPCYNAEHVLADQLDALTRQEWEGAWEVIVADNGSTDCSADVVRRFRERIPGLRIVDASARRCAAHARNAGARAARGCSIAFLDADDVAAEGWIAAIGTALRRDAFVASRHDFTRLNPEWLIGHRGTQQSRGLQQLWYPPYLSHSGACGLGMRRELFEAMGGFDESLRHLEDTDICLRVQKAGVPLVFVPDAVVHIRLQRNPKSRFRQARHWAHYNTCMYRRHRLPGQRIHGAWRIHWREWRLLFHEPVPLRPGGRRDLLWRLGWQLGLLTGSIRYRVTPAVFAPRVNRDAPTESADAKIGGGHARVGT